MSYFAQANGPFIKATGRHRNESLDPALTAGHPTGSATQSASDHAEAADGPAVRVVTVFRSRLRPDAEAEGYSVVAERMEARARAMPGFVDFKTFSAPDGERVSIVVFDSYDHHQAWRDDPEHRAAQELGRNRFYSEYSISVCAEERYHRFG